jgi:hypothetical protein
MTEAGQFAMWLAIGGTTISTVVMLYPIARAWARRIEGGAIPGDIEARLEALERREVEGAEADFTRQRLAELEERLDFAERLLGRARSADAALPRGAE